MINTLWTQFDPKPLPWWKRVRLFFKRTTYSVDWDDEKKPYVIGWKKLDGKYYIMKAGTVDEVFGHSKD